MRCSFSSAKVLIFCPETQCATSLLDLATCPGVGRRKVTQPQKQTPPDVTWGSGAKGSGTWVAGLKGEADGARGASAGRIWPRG